MKRLAAIFVVLLASGIAALGQDDESNGFIVNLIQDSLSTENRQIRLRGIDGLLASDATVEEITIADSDGVWLTIKDADIIWTRRALFSKQLKINSLKAGSIEVARPPVPDPSLPTLEAEPFSLPELPLSVEIGELEVASITLGQPVIGQAAELSLAGFLNLADGSLDTQLDLKRLDAPGSFSIATTFENASENLKVDFAFQEPKDGLLANLMKVEGRPSLDVTVFGEGTLKDIDLTLSAILDGTPAIMGDLRLREAANGLGFDANITGQLSGLIAPSYSMFFEGDSEITVSGVNREAGGFDLNNLKVKTAALAIEGDASTTDDGFLRRAKLTGTLGDGQSPTVLPFGGDVLVNSVELDASFGVDPTGLWDVRLTGDNLQAGDIRATAFNLLFQGTADGIETPAARAITINAIGDLSGLSASTPDLSRALGQRLTFQLASDWTPESYTIKRARIGGAAARIELEGLIRDLGFDGEITAKIDRLAPFGGAVGRDLQGAVDLNLTGLINPLAGSFDLTLDGTSTALKLDVPALDPLLVGNTDLSGRVLRNETGFRTQNVSLSNRQIQITSDGVIASARADLKFNATLRDLRVLTNQASGQVTFDGSAKGTDGTIAIKTGISIPQGTVLAKPLNGLTARFDGVMTQTGLTGTLAGNGRLDAQSLSVFAEIETDASEQTLSDLRLAVGPTRLVGDLNRNADGLMQGELDLTSPDISLLATLFLQDATGQANAKLTLSSNALGQQVVAVSDLADVALGSIQIGRANLDMQVQNALGVPTIAGALDFSDAIAGGVEIARGTLSAGGRDGRTDFTANLNLTNETTVQAVGALNTTETGYDLGVTKLDINKDGPLLRLEGPATARIEGERIDLDRLAFAVGDGTIRANGLINGGYDISVALDNLPLSVANAFRDDLGLQGSISGQATVGGPRDAPDLKFDLSALGLSAAALNAAELPPFDITAKGETADGKVTLQTTLTGPNALDSSIAGTIALSDLEMDLQGDLNTFPLALIDQVAGGQGLRGTVTGSFNLLNTPAKPRINFDLDGRGISVSVMRDNGVAPLSFSTAGSFVNDVITLPAARVTGASSMNFELSGRIPLKLDGLDAAANGTVPLSVINVALARNGLSASGTANISLRASGNLSDPNLSGSLTLGGGTFVSAKANLRLEDVNIDANFAGNRLNLTRARARNSRGGIIAADGSIVIDRVSGFPINLNTTVTDLRYTDGRLATALASGTLNMTGALMRRSEIAGEVVIEELEFALPQQLGTKKSYQLDVRHINITPPVRETLNRSGLGETSRAEVREDSDIAFDVTVSAPNRVYVRGRGVDAELGGSLKIGGTTRNFKPVGQFNLIRGRINILARRIELDEGNIRLNGTTDPELFLLARTVTDDVEATVTLEGPASKPILAFSSVPELPDDEVLARLVFDRSLSNLSALQVAQLAAAVGELSGRTGPSFFSQLRDATGLDDLDFETDNQGKTTVRVGKYIQENIYSSIEADNQGSSRATVNLDINENFKAKGTLDNQGNTSFGIFFEKDY